MTMQYVSARDLVVQVLAADATTWVEVEGLNSVGMDPSANEVMADKTVYGSDGNYSGIKMQVGASLDLQGLKLKDSITGVQATGQLRCTTLAAAVAYAGLGQVRFRDEIDTLWTVWTEATFSVGAQTGGNNDLRSFACAVGRNGASSTASVA